MIAVAEIMSALEDLSLQAIHYETFVNLMDIYRAHVTALLSVQTADGRWPNILTNNETYLETSSTAMFLVGFLRGIERDWFEGSEREAVLDGCRLAWNALARVIEDDGTILFIQPGTGIKSNEDGYIPRNTEYENAGPGVGGVLRAIAAVGRILDGFS